MSDAPSSDAAPAPDAATSNDKEYTCRLCGNPMQDGFIMDTEKGGATNARWIPGAAQHSFWSGVKIPRQVQIQALRCGTCFHVDMWAPEGQADPVL